MRDEEYGPLSSCPEQIERPSKTYLLLQYIYHLQSRLAKAGCPPKKLAFVCLAFLFIACVALLFVYFVFGLGNNPEEVVPFTSQHPSQTSVINQINYTTAASMQPTPTPQSDSLATASTVTSWQTELDENWTRLEQVLNNTTNGIVDKSTSTSKAQISVTDATQQENDAKETLRKANKGPNLSESVSAQLIVKTSAQPPNNPNRMTRRKPTL